MVKRSVLTSSFILFPVMFGMAATAESIVKILLTEKWLQAVPFLQIHCFIYALWPIHTANLQALNAIGRSDIYLKVEITKKIVGIAILVISMFYGIYAIALGGLVSGLVNIGINSYPNKKILNYGFAEQLKDIAPSFFLAILMAGFVYTLNYININMYALLISQVLIGGVFYILLAYLLKLECFVYLINITKNISIFKEK